MYTSALITILDILLIVHAARTGRFMPWGFVILFLPGVGALVYVAFALAPEWFGSYGAQRTRRSIAAALDPTGRYRALRDELDLVDTIANRSALAEECLNIGRPQESLEHYELILALPLGDEPAFRLGKARALLELGRAQEAVATLEEVRAGAPNFHSRDGHLLCARALEFGRAARRGARRLRPRFTHVPRPRAARPRGTAPGAARPTRPGAIDRGGGRALAQSRATPCSGERARMVRPRQGARPLTLAPRVRRGEKRSVAKFVTPHRTAAMRSKTAIVVTADPAAELAFDVVVRETDGDSKHRVTVSAVDAARFFKLGADPARAVEAAMAFLLDREPKELILGAFDINAIRRYFPEFDKAFPAYLARSGDETEKRE